jgi:hypothetical protein
VNKTDLDHAVALAKEFVRRAETVRWDTVGDYPYPASNVETAATKRASLDLTRALARMRTS